MNVFGLWEKTLWLLENQCTRSMQKDQEWNQWTVNLLAVRQEQENHTSTVRPLHTLSASEKNIWVDIWL